MNRGKEKFYFKGSYYPMKLVRREASKVTGVKESLVETEEALQELVDVIIKGSPTLFYRFVSALNAELLKK